MIKDQKLDNDILHQRNVKKYAKRMKSNKYWKKGFKAAEGGQSIDEIPYKFSEEVLSLIRKRTFWLLGFEDYDAHYGKKARLKEIAKLRKDQEKENNKVIKKMEKHKEKNRHKKKKKRHGKHKHKV